MNAAKKLIFPFLFLFLIVFASNIFAQDTTSSEPKSEDEENTATLEETTEWIKGKLENFLTKDSAGNKSQFKINFKGCAVEEFMIEEVKDKDGLYVKLKWTYVYNLSDFDPLSVKFSQSEGTNPIFNVEIKTTNDKKQNKAVYTYLAYTRGKNTSEETHKRITDNLNKEIVSYHSASSLGPLSREDAKRVVKAFKHAISLCGGKVEPF